MHMNEQRAKQTTKRYMRVNGCKCVCVCAYAYAQTLIVHILTSYSRICIYVQLTVMCHNGHNARVPTNTRGARLYLLFLFTWGLHFLPLSGIFHANVRIASSSIRVLSYAIMICYAMYIALSSIYNNIGVIMSHATMLARAIMHKVIQTTPRMQACTSRTCACPSTLYPRSLLKREHVGRSVPTP